MTRRDLTELLDRWRQGDHDAAHTVMPLVYDELRRIAYRLLASERKDHTLQATAVVHETCLKLSCKYRPGRPPDFLALDNAMRVLDENDKQKSQIVTLRVFGGLTVAETAEYLGTSPRTINLFIVCLSLPWSFHRARSACTRLS